MTVGSTTPVGSEFLWTSRPLDHSGGRKRTYAYDVERKFQCPVSIRWEFVSPTRKEDCWDRQRSGSIATCNCIAWRTQRNDWHRKYEHTYKCKHALPFDYDRRLRCTTVVGSFLRLETSWNSGQISTIIFVQTTITFFTFSTTISHRRLRWMEQRLIWETSLESALYMPSQTTRAGRCSLFANSWLPCSSEYALDLFHTPLFMIYTFVNILW